MLMASWCLNKMSMYLPLNCSGTLRLAFCSISWQVNFLFGTWTFDVCDSLLDGDPVSCSRCTSARFCCCCCQHLVSKIGCSIFAADFGFDFETGIDWTDSDLPASSFDKLLQFAGSGFLASPPWRKFCFDIWPPPEIWPRWWPA